MLISETPLVSLIPDLGLFGVKCTGLALFVGVDNSEAIELSEKYGEKYSSRVLSRSVVTTLRPHPAFASSRNVSHVCYIFPLMPNNKRLLELALKGLQAERFRIDEEITELTSLLMHGVGNDGTPRKTRTGAAGDSVTGHALIGSEPKRKGTLTVAGRKKLSEAAKRRWAANRKTGKTTL